MPRETEQIFRKEMPRLPLHAVGFPDQCAGMHRQKYDQEAQTVRLQSSNRFK